MGENLDLCRADCPICSGYGWVRREGAENFGRLFECPNSPRKFVRAGVEEEDLAVPGKLEQTGALALMRKALGNLLQAGSGILYIYGGYGVGKTACARAATVLACQKGWEGRYEQQIEINNRLRQAYDGEHGQADVVRILESLTGLDWLVVDEIGRDRNTEFGHKMTSDLMDRRYRQAVRGRGMTVLISNEVPEKVLEAHIADRIRDRRVAEVLELSGKSQRR